MTRARALVGFVQAHAVVIALALAALLLIGDVVTGVEIAFTLLYAAPIAIAAWWRGRTFGLVVAGICVLGATAVDIVLRLQQRLPMSWGQLVWNEGGSLLLFGVGVQLIVRLREYADKEARDRRATVEQLRQAERLGVVGKLASGLAHELGTPLNVIVGHAELVDSDRATRAMIHASSTTILAQADKMTTTIRGLLDFARRAGGERSDVDLATLAQHAAALLRPVAKKKGVDIAVDAKRDGGVTVDGNPTELEQVLVNLMMNGIQAMADGGTLHVRAHRARVADARADASDEEIARTACLEVEDQGVGIATESLPQIFDPFFTTKGVGEGTGLGLSVSYGIVCDHGGRIEVASVAGSGSRFSVYLPLTRHATSRSAW